MEPQELLVSELQSLDAVPHEFAAAAAKESQARRDLVDDERRLAAAKKALENAAQEVEATTKTSCRVSGFLTGKSRGYKREAELAERCCRGVRDLTSFMNSLG